MTPAEALALGQRAVAAKAFRWMPGMLDYFSGSRVLAVHEDGTVTWDDLVTVGSGYETDREHRCEKPSYNPDLRDPATAGGLLFLVREARGRVREQLVTAMRNATWPMRVGLGPDGAVIDETVKPDWFVALVERDKLLTELFARALSLLAMTGDPEAETQAVLALVAALEAAPMIARFWLRKDGKLILGHAWGGVLTPGHVYEIREVLEVLTIVDLGASALPTSGHCPCDDSTADDIVTGGTHLLTVEEMAERVRRQPPSKV